MTNSLLLPFLFIPSLFSFLFMDIKQCNQMPSYCLILSLFVDWSHSRRDGFGINVLEALWEAAAGSVYIALQVLRTNTLWCGVVWCGVVWCGVVWCGVVWCGVVWCRVVWCSVVWCGVVRCNVMWCNEMRYDVVWCGAVWCDVMWCDMM